MSEINPLLNRAPTRPSGFMKALENAKAGAGGVETAKVGLGKSGLKAAFERARAAAAESVRAESVQAESEQAESDPPRAPKAFKMMKEAAAEAEAVAATQVISRLRPRRVNKMAELTADAPKPTVEAKSPKSPKTLKLPDPKPEQTEVAEKPTDGEKYFRLIVNVEPVGPYRESTPRLPYVKQNRSIGMNASVGSHARVGTRTNENGETLYSEYCGWEKDKYGRIYPTVNGEIVVIRLFNETEGTYLVDIVNPPVDEPWYKIRALKFHADCLREL